MPKAAWLLLIVLAVVPSGRSQREIAFEYKDETDQEDRFEAPFDVADDNRRKDLGITLEVEETEKSDDDDDTKSFNMLTAFGQLFKTGDGRRYSILNLAYQLSCYQGRGGSMIRQALWALHKYHKYGCYCGSSHYSGNYVDATDRCCKAHNTCYRKAQKKYNIGNTCKVFTTQYSVSCCKKQKNTRCTDSGPSAARALCNCDQAMAKCVSRKTAMRTYNKKNRKNRKKCHATSPYIYKKAPSGIMGILKQCKAKSKPIRKFPIKYGSQGKCPGSKKKKKNKGWWIFGKDQ